MNKLDKTKDFNVAIMKLSDKNKLQKEMFLDNETIEIIKAIDTVVLTIEQLKEKYKQKYKDYTEQVKRYEEMYRNTPSDSFYKLSHLKTIQKLNAKRECLKDVIKDLGGEICI